MKIKPQLGLFRRELIGQDWDWFWSRHSLCILFNESSLFPLALVDGEYQNIITTFLGTTGGTSTAKIDAGPTGVRADFIGANGAGGGEWGYHISDADLLKHAPWFPGVNAGTPSNEFTCLALVNINTNAGGQVNTILQKDATTGSPFFLFQRDGNYRANLGSGTSNSDVFLLNQEELVGCVYDGTNLNMVRNSRWQDPIATASVLTNTGPLNIGTRTATVDTSFTNRLDGAMSLVIFIDMAVDGYFLHRLEVDPFGPFRSQPIASAFAQQAILPPATQNVTIGQMHQQTAGKSR